MPIQSNSNVEYAVLVGITPVAKAGWYSGLNNLDVCLLYAGKE